MDNKHDTDITLSKDAIDKLFGKLKWTIVSAIVIALSICSVGSATALAILQFFN